MQTIWSKSLGWLLTTPVCDLFQSFRAGLLEQAYTVAGVFKFMNVGPDFGAPRLVMSSRLAATGTAGVKLDRQAWCLRAFLKLYKDRAYFLDFIVLPHDVLVSQ